VRHASRHCELGEAIQKLVPKILDCFVALSSTESIAQKRTEDFGNTVSCSVVSGSAVSGI
jgi:hypothetical protein